MNYNQQSSEDQHLQGPLLEKQSGDFDELLKYLKIALGIILLVIGVYIGIWLFSKIVVLVNEPDKITSFRIADQELQSFEFMTDDGEHVKFPVGPGMSFLIYIILLSIGAGLCSTFIKAGVNLLHSSLGRLENKINKLRDKIDRSLKK